MTAITLTFRKMIKRPPLLSVAKDIGMKLINRMKNRICQIVKMPLIVAKYLK